jgi:hypothetical protein
MNAQSTPSDRPVPVYKAWAEKHGTPWQVTFPKRGAVPTKRRFFPTEDAANAEIEKWLKDRKPEAGLGKRVVDEVVHCRALLPPDVSLLDCVRFYVEHHSGLTTVTVQEVADDYLADLKAQKKSADYRDEQERWAGIFVTELGAETLFSSIGKARLLKFIKSDSESYWNRYARKRIASCLVSKAIELEALRMNPLDGWKFEDAPKKRPHFLLQADAEIILTYAWDHKK